MVVDSIHAQNVSLEIIPFAKLWVGLVNLERFGCYNITECEVEDMMRYIDGTKFKVKMN